MAAKVLGRDPYMAGSLWRAMVGAYAGGDMTMMPVSAIDMALWDLRGRIEGLPVSTLLGGRLRDKVTAYASGPFMKPGDDPYRDFAAEAEAYLEAGFRAVKARCGATPSRDAAMAMELRSRLGQDVPLMVDANRGYARPAALEAARRLEEAGLLWIEKPIAPDDIEGYRALADSTTAPLAAGEAQVTLAQFHAFLATGAVSVIQRTSICAAASPAR